MPLTQVHNSLLGQPVNHNILINPSFTVKQYGDVIEHDTSTYGPDRWILRGIDSVGGTYVRSSTVVDPTTGINKIVVNHDSGGVDACIIQRIETVNLQGLYGKEMTLSFSYSDEGESGIPKVRLLSYDSSGSWDTIFEGEPTSLGDSRWTCTFTLSTRDGTIPDFNERGLRLDISANEGNTAPSEWSVWETKLEAGSVATPFIARSYGEELALCQRYYQVFGVNSVFAGRGNSTSAIAVSVVPFVPLRASPSIPSTVSARAYSTSGSTSTTNAGLSLSAFDVYLYIKFDGFNPVLADNRVGSIQLAQAMPLDSEL